MRVLVDLPNEDRNLIVPLAQYVQVNKIDAMYCNKDYYPYDLDVKDSGWGCAWRCIQMMLSRGAPHFRYLFYIYGCRYKLLQIYISMYGEDSSALKYLYKAKFAPHELANGWAEPFIGHLILHPMGKKSTLLLVNGYPPSANAPNCVFHQVVNFLAFKQILLKHFKSNGGLVMLDDATYAVCIFGIVKTNDDTFEILIADPHIGSNKKELAGLYTVTLDEYGRQISNNVTNSHAEYLIFKSHLYIDFYNKKWMVLLYA